MLNKLKNKKLFGAIFIVVALFFVLLSVQPIFAQNNIQDGLDTVAEQTDLGNEDPKAIIGRILKVILGFLGVLAIGLVLYGGFVYMTAGGSEEKIGNAKKILISAAIGLAIILSAYAITAFVFDSLLDANNYNSSGDGDGNGNGTIVVSGFRTLEVDLVPEGDTVLYSFPVKLMFNYPLDSSSATDIENNVKVEKSVDGTFEEVPGEFNLFNENRIVKFVPDKVCSDCEDQNCFDKDSAYKVTVTPNVLQSIQTDRDGEKLTLSCNGISDCVSEFNTGSVCDKRDPSVVIENPSYNTSICQGSAVPMDVSIFGSDDVALSMLLFQVDLADADSWEDFSTIYQVVLNDSPTSYTYSDPWPESSDYELGSHKVVAAAVDLADHTKIKKKNFNIVPSDCCDELGEIDCSSTNPACPSCSGGCTQDSDCASGVCLEGQCKTLPTIDNVVLPRGGPGNLVTIVGNGFSSYKTDTSSVYFSCSSGENCSEGYMTGEFSCDTNSSWRDDQIIVRVPDSGVITGPVKIINRYELYDDTENDRGWQDDFVYDENLQMPGICAVSEQECQQSGETDCAAGPVSGLVNVEGSGFGNSRGDSDLYFDQVIASMQGGGAWDNVSITNLQIPNLANGYSTVVLKAGEQCISCPDCIDNIGDETCACTEVSTCDEVDDCICRDIYSNPYKFKIEAPANLPQINSVNPDPAPAQQLITLKGVNFGNSAGRVDFIDIDRAYVGELSCGESGWTDGEISVKIPEEVAIETGTKDIQIRVYSSSNLESAPINLTINSEKPGPGICQLSPNNGPVNTVFNLFGENFENDSVYDIVFENGGKVESFLTVEQGYDWQKESILGAKVSETDFSGNIYLANEDTLDAVSNQVGFRVGSCTNNSCLTGETCCSSGICKDIVEGCSEDADFGETEFSWMVSTGALPKYPKVIERSCDAENNLMASPAPMKNKRTVCKNSVISATFNTVMSWPSFEAQATETGQVVKVKTKQCSTPDTTGESIPNCDLDSCSDGDCITTEYATLTAANKLSDNICTTDVDDVTTCETVSRLEIDTPLVGNTWYQVEILGGEFGVAGATASGTDPVYTMPNSYRWKFKTKADDCLPTDIAITPAQGLIETVDEQEIYKVSGLNQCEILNLGDEDWNWQLPFESDRAKVELFGHLCRVYGDQYEICPVVGTFDVDKYISASEYVTVRKDFGIYQIKSDLIQNGLVSADIQTDKSNPITVRTSAAVNVETTTGTVVKNLTKDAGLLIDFIDPKVVNYFPRCDSACINTQIQAHFNTKMNATSVEAPANLKLYPCVTSECVTYGTAVNLNSANINYTYSNDGSGHYVNRLDINLAQDLSPDTSYRAIVMDDVTSVSGENLAGLNYSTQSGSGDCANREDDNENGKIDKTGGYDADGDEKVDFACGCFDSDSNSFKSYAKDPAAAKCKELIAIDFKCQNLVTDELLELTDDFAALLRGTNYTYYSPDKSCELAGDYEGGETVLLDSFSWTFRTKEGDGKCLIDRVEVAPSDFVSQTAGQTVDYVSTPFSVPDSCSATGQPLNAYQYDWDWSSVEDRIATVTAGTYNAAKPDFCSNSCLVVGNNEADLEDADKLCGNGLVDEGEECDTKIGEDLNPYCTASCVWQGFPTCGSLNKLYCQEDTSIECSEKVPINCTCTVPGYSLTPCCGNGILQDLDGVAGIDEECEAICVKDGQSCSYGDDGCVCTMPEGCNNKCLKTGSNQELCGNGVIENSEDPECDTAAGTNVGPYQTATVNPAINTLLADPANVCFTSGGSCLFNFNYLSLFTEGDTDIEAKAVEEAVEVTGSSELSYVTQQCLLPQVTLTDIKPTDNDTDVCTNSLIYATFDGKINPISLNRDSLKLTKEIPANETCPVDLPVVISHYGFDEGSGQSTYDSILNNQAEVVAGVFVDGQVGQALEFDGQDSVVKTSTSSFGQAKPWTVSAWINPASLAAEPKTIFTASADGSNESIGLAVFKGNILLLKTGEKGDPRINNFSGMRIPENVWSHIMISYDGLGNIFVNIDGQGKSKSTFSLVTKVALDDLSIGNRMENPQLDWAGFDGAIDEFTVFEQLLLKDEMTQYYQSITGDGVAVNSLNYKFTKNPVKAVKQSIYNGYQKVKLTVRDLLVKSGWAAAPKRCDVGFNFSVTENSFGNTEVLVVPHYLLGENTKYNLEFNSIENVCGKASSIGTSFTTGDEICRVNNVYINPADRFVTKPNVNAEYQAIAQNYDQPIQSIPNVYSWKWAWNSLDTSIANVGSYVDTEDPSKVNVASFNKNGQTAIEAKTIITDDTVSDSSTGGASVSGYSNLEVFICSKLWAPTDYSGDFSMYGTDSGYLTHLYHKIYNVGLFYCRDLGQPLVKSCYNGQACYDDADCAGIGDQLCRAPLVCSDGVTSCSSDTDCSEIGNGKCLMAGEHDDLPKLKVLSTDIFSDFVEAGQKTPANPDQVIKQCQDGIDNDLNGLSDLEDPKCNDANDNWEEPALLAQYFLSRTDVALDDNFDESEDVISLRIYENPEALAPELWYMKYAPNAGNISSLDIDCLESSTGKFCYQGGKEDNSVYIAAGNISTTGTLYNNIYLLGYNSGANSNTQNIFSQMIETIKFNINNLSEGTTGTTAKQSVMKDIRRVQDINLVHLLLDGYRSQNSNKVPQLESGTYVRGETFSVWPSWQRVFGSMLGGALPVDPDNHFVWEQATTNPTPQGEICQDLSAGSVELYCQGQKQCVVPGQWCSICPSAASDGDHDYDKYTCYSSDVTGANLPEFYSTVYSIISDNPVYHYQALGPNAYNIDFTLDGYAAGYNTEKQGFRFYNEFRVLPKRKTATGDICISGGDCDYIYK